MIACNEFGEVGFSFNADGELTELCWRKEAKEEILKLKPLASPCPSAAELKKYLNDFAKGSGPKFPGKYAFPQVAEFSSAVYRVVEKLNAGEVMSYQQVAVAAGSPKACRAVGNIMGKNPIPLVIP